MESPPVPNTAGQNAASRTPAALEVLLEARFAAGELELPLLPTYATQVVALCSDPSSDARAIAQLLQKDPALAAHVLAIANSAALGGRERVVSLQQAIARLGVRQLANVALSIAVKTKIFSAGKHLERMNALWRHSTLSGLFAREIARARRKNVENAYLCGLLHDVGSPVVIQAIDELQSQTRLSFDKQEIEGALERFHAEVGEQLVRSWSLPDWTAAAARHHHDPSAARECADEVYTAHLADRLADFADEQDGLSGVEPVLAALGMYEEDLAALQGDVEKIRAAAEVFA